MKIAFLNTKGGVGKTTLALNFSIAQAMAGRDVWLIDGDRQATAMQAVAQRADAGKKPALAVSHYVDGSLLRAQVQQQGPKFDDVVIDAGGRDSAALRAALMLSDCVIIPFQPRSFDVWGVADLSALIQETRAMRDGLKVFAVLNGADPAGKDNAEAAAAVAGIDGIEYLDAPVGRRKAIADAAGAGCSVLEGHVDLKARAEIRRLVDAVLAITSIAV